LGTTSLVLGIGLIVFGLAYWLIMEAVPWFVDTLNVLIISIPSIIIGALFLRKYDKDKKKEKEPIQNNEPEEKEDKMSKSEYQKTIIVVAGLIIAFILIIALSSWPSASQP